jgi:DNA-binding beta-propeller fold protein YncE
VEGNNILRTGIPGTVNSNRKGIHMNRPGSTRRIILILILFPVMSVLTTSPSGAFHLVKKWATDPVFNVPESVCWDYEREILYVSNIAGNPGEKDGEGFISRVSIEGEIKKLRWVTGLNAPKGMAVHGGKIYVSDIDELAVIDIRTDKVIEHHPVEGSGFLNDIAVDKNGNIYISDSSKENSVIYRFMDGEIEVWLRHKDIQSPNGLFVDGNRLVVGNSGDATLKAVDLKSRKVTTAVIVGSAVDGVKIDSKGNYIVTDWKGRTALIEPEGGIYILLDTRSEGVNAADIELVDDYDMVVIPTFSDNRVVATKLIY